MVNIMLGPRKAGKTTYLAALVNRFETEQSKMFKIGVEAISPAAIELKEDASNLLCKGDPLGATAVVEVEDLPNYIFHIYVPGKLLGKTKEIAIEIDVRDYAGEIFDDLNEDPIPEKLEKYLNSCANTTKWLLLLNDWEPFLNTGEETTDERYQKVITVLLNKANKLNQANKDVRRLAVVIGKCERGELWPGRLEPERDIFSVRLPKTHATLKRFFKANPSHLQFFACSAFGVIDPKTPLPNRRNVVRYNYRSAVMKDPNAWQPYGLITPLVWLETGKLWKWSYI